MASVWPERFFLHRSSAQPERGGAYQSWSTVCLRTVSPEDPLGTREAEVRVERLLAPVQGGGQRSVARRAARRTALATDARRYAHRRRALGRPVPRPSRRLHFSHCGYAEVARQTPHGSPACYSPP